MNSEVTVGCGLRSSQADFPEDARPYVITVQDDRDPHASREEVASVMLEVTDVKSDPSVPPSSRNPPSHEDYVILGYDEDLIKSDPEDELNNSSYVSNKKKGSTLNGSVDANYAVSCTAEDSVTNSENLENPPSIEIPESVEVSEIVPGHLESSGTEGRAAGKSIKNRPAKPYGGIKIVECFSLRPTDEVMNDRSVSNLESSPKNSNQKCGTGVAAKAARCDSKSNTVRTISLEDLSSLEEHAVNNQSSVKSRVQLRNTTNNLAKLCATDVENSESKDSVMIESKAVMPTGKLGNELDTFEDKARVQVVGETGRRVKKCPTRSKSNVAASGSSGGQGFPKGDFAESDPSGFAAEYGQMCNGTRRSRQRHLKVVAAELMPRTNRGLRNADSAAIDESEFESCVSSDKIDLLGVLGLGSACRVTSRYKGGQRAFNDLDHVLNVGKNGASSLAYSSYRKSSRMRKPPKYDDNFEWEAVESKSRSVPKINSFDSKLTAKADPCEESLKNLKLWTPKKSAVLDKLSAKGPNLKVRVQKKPDVLDKLSAKGRNLKVQVQKKSAVDEHDQRKQPKKELTVKVRELSVVLKDINSTSSLITKSTLDKEGNGKTDQCVIQEVKSAPKQKPEPAASALSNDDNYTDYFPRDDYTIPLTSSKIPEDAALRRKAFSCRMCKYGTWSESQFKVHMRAHERKEYKCKQCPYMATGASCLEIHMRKHTGEKPFKCTSCEYSASTMGSLNIHVRNHIGDKRFVCPECGHRAMTSSHLQVHMRKHTGVKPYACSRCDYSSANGGHLKRHMLIHTGEKRNACTLCSYKAARPEALEFHMRTHSDERNYKCGLCDYASHFSSALTRHMQKHYGTLPKHNCTECSYSTSTANELKMHIRTHTGEKPYKCSECQYTARRPNHMTVHMRIHKGLKPFKCESCDYTARTSSRLKNHNLAKHLGETKRKKKFQSCSP